MDVWNKLFHSWAFWLDWIFAILGWYLMKTYQKYIADPKSSGSKDLITLAMLAVAVGGCLYLSWECGTLALKEVGIP